MRARVLFGAILSASLALSLSACGGGSDDAPAPPPPPAAVDPTQACKSLAGVVIAATDIKLPTQGAKVAAAVMQAASGAGASATPEYCKVSVQIASVDSSAPPINVQVNLPTNWNQKALQMGGGGFDGLLVTAEGAATSAAAQPTPLSTGYATFGSDSGHSVPNILAVEEQVQAFLNDEVVVNYAAAQLKKTRDVAAALMKTRYGNLPKRMYFIGGSAGGREALLVAQRYGEDYDGSIAWYPAAGGVPLLMGFARTSRALAAPGAYPNVAKQKLLKTAVVKACDAADGAVDGIVSNPSACHFDVSTIRCPSGNDEGDACLSDAQIGAMNVMNSETILPYTLTSGEKGIKGINVYAGVDLSAPGSGLAFAAPVAKPSGLMQPAHDWLYDIFYRGILTRDPGANSLAFDPYAPGVYLARLNFLSSMFWAGNPDLSTFQKRGGKLIVVHGKDDALIPVGWSADYYQSVVAKMGLTTVDGFMRYFEIPGYGHGVGAFTVDWNSLQALDDWVEKGTAVDKPIVTDVNPGSGGRTRPLCRYPSWPKYSGFGDVNSAANFTCATS